MKLQLSDARLRRALDSGNHSPQLLERPSVAIRAVAVRGLAVGAVAIGAIALGALAIGALAIGRLAVADARIRRLDIDELVVRRLRVTGDIQTPTETRA